MFFLETICCKAPSERSAWPVKASVIKGAFPIFSAGGHIVMKEGLPSLDIIAAADIPG